MLKTIKNISRAQTAVEYLLLLGVVTAIMMAAFKQFLPQVNRSSEFYYNEAATRILGPPPLNGLQESERRNYP